MKRIFRMVIVVFLFLVPYQVSANTTQPEIDLNVEPADLLFDLTNLKPGDSVTRNLNISNSGRQDLEYILTSTFKGGSEIFYRQLDLKISNSKNVLYEGKLFNFSGFQAKTLASKSSEELTFFIQIPYELGNEYQGLSTEFQLKLATQGILASTVATNGSVLPNTATSMFSTISIGLILILASTILYVLKLKKRKET